MTIRTRVFELAPEQGFTSLRALARAMNVDVGTLSRVKRNECGITQGFILGALRAFPDLNFEDLFEIVDDEGLEPRERISPGSQLTIRTTAA